MTDLFSETWVKFLTAALAALAAIIAWISSWKKERAIDDQTRSSMKESIPAIMQSLSKATAVPMPAFQLDHVNNLLAASEKLVIALDRHTAATDRQAEETRRQTEETRRAAVIAEKQAEEARRLQGELRDVREAFEQRRLT